MITTDQERADVALRWVLGEKQRDIGLDYGYKTPALVSENIKQFMWSQIPSCNPDSNHVRVEYGSARKRLALKAWYIYTNRLIDNEEVEISNAEVNTVSIKYW